MLNITFKILIFQCYYFGAALDLRTMFGQRTINEIVTVFKVQFGIKVNTYKSPNTLFQIHLLIQTHTCIYELYMFINERPETGH